MPLPIILGAAAAVAAIGGVGSGISGASKMKEAHDVIKEANIRHQKNQEKFDDISKNTNEIMDRLATLELSILKSFDDFSNVIERIQNRPNFKGYKKDLIDIPEYNQEDIKNVSVGAGAILGGLGGAVMGTAGGFAAAGATTSAVTALGVASTGTAISSLSGVAATNATLAAIGGGSIAAGGGGIALGSAILGASTLGVGLLVGGVIFNLKGSKLSDDADKVVEQVKEAEKNISLICNYLEDLRITAIKYTDSLIVVRDKYNEIFGYVKYVVNTLKKEDWNDFSESEKVAIQNTVLLVGLLYKMCSVNLVKKSTDESKPNTVNHFEVNKSIEQSNLVLSGLQ